VGTHDERAVSITAPGMGVTVVRRRRIGPSGWEVTVHRPNGDTIRMGLHPTVRAAVEAVAEAAAREIRMIG